MYISDKISLIFNYLCKFYIFCSSYLVNVFFIIEESIWFIVFF